MSWPHKSAFPEMLEALASEHLPHLSKLGRRERRAAETRVRLFRSAMRLFAQRGFQNVTVEDITDAADVGKGTFFNYFESKDQVLGVMAEIQLGKVREVLEQAEAGKQPVRSVLHNLFQRVAEEPGRSPEMTRALISTFLASDQIRSTMAGNLAEGRRMVAKILELGQRRGEVASVLKPEQLARQCQQSMIGTLLFWSLRGDEKLATRLEESFQHFWRAITLNKEAQR
jgi:AcrR family transcriptional regulator